MTIGGVPPQIIGLTLVTWNLQMWDWKTVILELPLHGMTRVTGTLPLELTRATRGLGFPLDECNWISLRQRHSWCVWAANVQCLWQMSRLSCLYNIYICEYICICNICIYTYPIISLHIISLSSIPWPRLISCSASVAVLAGMASLLASRRDLAKVLRPQSLEEEVQGFFLRVSLMTQGGYRLWFSVINKPKKMVSVYKKWVLLIE